MKGLSALCLLFAIDAVIGLVQGNNMYTLKPGGATGILVNVATLVICLLLGPTLWKRARRRDEAEAIASYLRAENSSAPATPKDAYRATRGSR